MEYRTLGRTGLKVSELVLGTMTFGWTTDEATARQILDRAYEAGINLFDTADIYSTWGGGGGVAEEILGRWVKDRGIRDRVLIATKVRGRMGEGPNDEGLSRHHIVQALEASLRRLQTDYVDLYQVHWPDEETDLEETLRALDDLVRAGKVRYIGCSNYPAWLVVKALWISDRRGFVPFQSVQPHYNLLHRAEFERELAAVCRDQGLGVLPYSPLAGGYLTGKYRKGKVPPGSRAEFSPRIRRYMTERGERVLDRLTEIGLSRGKTPAQIALAWLLSHPVITAPIVGARTPEQLEETLGAVGLRLTPEEKESLDELTRWQDEG